MNPLKLIYNKIYYDFKKRGNEENARVNGTIISAIAIFIPVLTAFLLLIIYYPDFEQKSNALFFSIFDDMSVAKGLFKLLFVFIFVAIYLLIKYTIGTEASHTKIIEEFLALAPDEQKTIKKRATPYLLIPMILLMITIIVLMNK